MNTVTFSIVPGCGVLKLRACSNAFKLRRLRKADEFDVGFDARTCQVDHSDNSSAELVY